MASKPNLHASEAIRSYTMKKPQGTIGPGLPVWGNPQVFTDVNGISYESVRASANRVGAVTGSSLSHTAAKLISLQ